MSKFVIDTELIGLEIVENYEEEDFIWADICEVINEYLSDAFNEIAEIVSNEFENRGVEYEC